MAYIGSSPTKVVSRQSANIFTYTATANQTAFTGADANGNTLACSPSDLMVHMNGIKLEESDYTATTTTVTLGSGAAAGDEVTITAFLTFESADHYTKSAADTRYVNASGDTMTGDLVVSKTSGATINVNTALNGAVSKVILHEGSTASPANGATLEYDGSTNVFSIGVGSNISTKRLSIGRDSGAVTMPYQPSFHATLSSNQTGYNATTSSGTQDYIQYNSDIYDIGNNHSGGTFTAPVDGVYLFRAEAYANVGWSQTWWLVNGARAAGTDTVYASSTSFAHSTAILKLSANDTVRYRGYISGATNATIYAHANHTWFRGILIG